MKEKNHSERNHSFPLQILHSYSHKGFFSFSNALSVFIDIYEFAELTPTRTFTVDENMFSDFLWAVSDTDFLLITKGEKSFVN